MNGPADPLPDASPGQPVDAVVDVATVADLPKARTAYIGIWPAAHLLGVDDRGVRYLMRQGLLPAYRVDRRYYIDPADLDLVLDHVPRLPPRMLARDDARRREVETARAEVARLQSEVAALKAEKRWELLEEMSLQELLEYLKDFHTDNWRESNAKYETVRGLQRAVDQENYGLKPLGARPKGVPHKATNRRLSTAIGPVDIWYWPKPSGGWGSTYGGPRPARPGGRSAYPSATSAIKHAGQLARAEYGKPSRRSSSRLRFQILARDGFACHYCGRKPPDVELHVDHIVSIAEGGADDEANLVTACADCNLGKSTTSIDE